MGKEFYICTVKIRDLLVNSKFEVYFKAEGKDYVINEYEGSIWLEDENNIRCKLTYFVTDGKMISVITEGECKLDGWAVLHKWDKV